MRRHDAVTSMVVIVVSGALVASPVSIRELLCRIGFRSFCSPAPPTLPPPRTVPPRPPASVQATEFGAMGIRNATVARDWGGWYRLGLGIGVDGSHKFTGGLSIAQAHAAGLRVSVGIRRAPGGPDGIEEQPLPADGSQDAALRDGVARLCAMLDPARDDIVIGNEVNTQKQWRGTPAQYGRIMRVVAEEAHARGFQVGGPAILAEPLKAAAGLTNDPVAAQKAHDYIAAAKDAGLDTFVFHSYVADPVVLATCYLFAVREFGGPVWINEIGFRSNRSNVTTGRALARKVREIGVPKVFWYGSGFGPISPAKLYDLATGAPTRAGQAILDEISEVLIPPSRPSVV